MNEVNKIQRNLKKNKALNLKKLVRIKSLDNVSFTRKPKIELNQTK